MVRNASWYMNTESKTCMSKAVPFSSLREDREETEGNEKKQCGILGIQSGAFV